MSSACGGPESPRLPSELTGTIVDVQSAGGEVQGFTLRSNGDTFDLSIANDVKYGFDLDHLREHLATGDPIRCTVEEREDKLYALSILDA